VIRIGRLTLPDPEHYQPGTDSVSVSGVLSTRDDPLSPAQAIFVAEQLAAMGGSDEIVPVIHETFSGFYRVVNANIAQFDPVWYTQGHGEYELTLSPVLGHGLPVVESVVTGAIRANGVSVTDARPFHAVPGSRLIHEWPETAIIDLGSTEARVVEGGSVDWQHAFEFSADNVYSGIATWVCEPEHWYEGACGVDVLVDGEYMALSGRRALNDTWVCGNGLVRFRVSGTDLTFEWYNDGDWSTPVVFTVDSLAGPCDWATARLLRLTPESASVILTADTGSTKARAASLACTIRRGSPWVDFRVTGVQGSPLAPQVTADTATAATDMTYGMRRTTAASGWIWVVATTIANTVDTTNGTLRGTSDGITSFGIGAYHSSGAGNLDAADIHREWYAAQTERTVIGNRL
jgi:hypothetical protein